MRGLVCLVVLSFAVAAQASFYSEATQEWIAFKTQFNKNYEAVENNFRMKVFAENKRTIAEHNELFRKGETTYTMKMNRFGDLLGEEFAEMMNGLHGHSIHDKPERKGPVFTRAPANVEVPTSIDWRTKGAVTPVKDQAQCGSCWAFATTGSLEGQHFLKTGYLVSLSEQNLVDCSTTYGNYGCGGGWPEKAYEYILGNRGVDTESSYPYVGYDQSCYFQSSSVGATVTGYTMVEAGSEVSLENAVGTVGPVAVLIDATRSGFQFYTSGVYYDPGCSSTYLDHAVLAVGYDTDSSGTTYWIVKNSWGDWWGNEGYINMARNYGNMCGIATEASFPTV